MTTCQRASPAMKRFIFVLFLSAVFLPVQAKWLTLDYSSVRVQSDYQSINGKDPFWLLIEFKMRPGWHSYWRNPGASGLAPAFTFNLPEGFRASAIHWLPPSRFPSGSFINYGYADKAWHLIQIHPQYPVESPIIPIEIDASWLVCEQECIPQHTVLTFSLQQGNHNVPSPNFDRIHKLVGQTQLPSMDSTMYPSDGHLHLVFPNARHSSAYFYPEQKNLIKAEATQALTVQGQQSLLTMPAGSAKAQYPVKGVLELEQEGKRQYYRIAAPLEVPTDQSFLPLMLLFALLGGLILNLMPCVFPILSLKILALRSTSNKRLQGLFYTLGVVVTFCAIALLMLLLQSFGKNIGWGFQLQSPAFNISLIFLFSLISLNLFGFFDIPFSLNTNLRWQNNHQYLYSFATGILACVVATPCSAPFMATAVGVALSQNTLTALLIFVFLGIGLALPYVFICFIPALAALLPKPGAWMETLKQLLAFPMLLSVIWLLWVLGQQVAFNAIILLLISLCALLFAFWVRKRLRQRRSKLLIGLLSLSLIVYPIYIMYEQKLLQPGSDIAVKPFSMERLQELRQAKQAVFVYATAAWCITCQVNESVALDTQRVQDFFKKKQIQVLKADWTNQNANILQYLQSFGRAGVPLYVYYPPERAPIILPQLLSPGIIMEQIRATEPQNGASSP
ncbi:MAG: thioredoxin family protein [Legionellaceae bacterium]|nr:thioredoxin family protein [Legionellaceae bacterium]